MYGMSRLSFLRQLNATRRCFIYVNKTLAAEAVKIHKYIIVRATYKWKQ